MALNIKNAETNALIRELASLTGETMTEAVNGAVRARLEKERRQRTDKKRQRLEELLELAQRTAAQIPEPVPDHGELLYDEMGLPR